MRNQVGYSIAADGYIECAESNSAGYIACVESNSDGYQEFFESNSANYVEFSDSSETESEVVELQSTTCERHREKRTHAVFQNIVVKRVKSFNSKKVEELSATLRKRTELHRDWNQEACESLAKFLLFTNDADVEYLAPLVGKFLKIPSDIALSKDFLLIHYGKDVGQGHSKRAYQALAIHRKSYQFSKVVYKEILGEKFFQDTYRELDLAELLKGPHVASAPLAAFHWGGEESHMALYEPAYKDTLEGIESGHELQVLRGAAQGLAVLHAKGFVHGDVTPGNIFVTHSYDGDLGDLGAAQREGNNLHPLGNIFYRPPEEYVNQAKGKVAQTRAGDIWSLGLTIAEKLRQNTAGFHAIWDKRVSDYINKGVVPHLEKSEIDAIFRKDLNPQIRQVIERCMDLDPEKRPTAEELAGLLDIPK